MKAMYSKFFTAGVGFLGTIALTAASGVAQMAPSTNNSDAPMRTGDPGATMQPQGSTQAPPHSTASPQRSSLSAIDRQFIIRAAQSDMTEIRTSRLALQRSQNTQVRQYAQHMINQHTQSSNQLKPIAQKKGVTLPKSIGAPNQALYTQLSKLSGSQFDQAYMKGQLAAHTRTEAEYRREVQQGSDPAVKAFASKVLPIVAEHRQMAQGMVANR